MNKLKPASAQGMPYHGLAMNGELAITGGVLPVDTAHNTYTAEGGQCVVMRHPAAPGVNRNAGQQAADAATGQEWRDYALLTGKSRAFNGGPALGRDKWLYCDPAGGTWVIRLAHAKNGSQITFEVWLDAIFGRTGRPRYHTPRLLASLVWSPQIPTWGSTLYSQADVVDGISLDWINALAINQDGSEVFIHVVCIDSAINELIYSETTPAGAAGFNHSTALVSILRCDIAGTGDMAADGAGIVGALFEDLGFEGGLVTNRITGAGSETPGSFPGSYFALDISQPTPSSDPADCPATQTFSLVAIEPLTGSVFGGGVGYDAILYKTSDGVVQRTLNASDTLSWVTTAFNGGATREYEVDTGSGFCTCISSSGSACWGSTEMTQVSQYDLTVTCFGAAPVHVNWTRTQVQVISSELMSKDNISYLQCNGVAFPQPGGVPPNSLDIALTINGVNASHDHIYGKHEVRQLAQNLHYVATYLVQAADGSQHDLVEHVFGVNDAGSAAEIYSKSTASTWEATAADQPDMPTVRELVWSWQPVTEQFVHAPRTLYANYNGDTYQYV